MSLRASLGFSVLGVLLACGSEVSQFPGDNGSGGIGGDGGNTVGGQGAGIPANSVTINSVALYQSVERVLSADGAPQTSMVPIVAGRDALLRVFHGTAPAQGGKSVIAQLTIDGADPIAKPAVLSPLSRQGTLGSTINFDVPGELLEGAFSYRVDIFENGPADASPIAQYPEQGLESHAIEIPRNTLRVVLVPFQYNADGSGRLPDMSPANVERYRQRFTQLFPVSDVEVSVREPIPWNTTISPSGTGWQAAMEEVYGLRLQDGVSPDTYYYGVFNPLNNIGSFCAQGCILGVTVLNNQPFGLGSPELRWAVGLGYPQVAFDTASHELGHAHGREHVDCGNPQSIDSAYPHDPRTIGSWGYDLFAEQLIDPGSHSDMMGYCDPTWVSDYTFAALGARGQNVNLPEWQGAHGMRMRMVMFDGTGKGSFQPLSSTPPQSLASSDVKLTRNGEELTVGGTYHAFDHLPGGVLLYPERIGEEPDRVSVVVNGTTLVAER